MFFNKTLNGAGAVLWAGVAVTIGLIIYALWYNMIELSIVLLIISGVLLMLLGYVKYTEVMRLKRRFIMIQETFTTAVLIYFAYSYFDKTHELLPQKTLDKTTKQFKDVYQKTRYHLTFPLILMALKTFGEVKRAKKSVQSEVRDFISSDGFNIENAQRLTREIGVFVEKIKNLSALISGGFDSVKSWATVLDTKADFSTPSSSSSQKSAVRSSVSVKSRRHRTKESEKTSAPKNK